MEGETQEKYCPILKDIGEHPFVFRQLEIAGFRRFIFFKLMNINEPQQLFWPRLLIPFQLNDFGILPTRFVDLFLGFGRVFLGILGWGEWCLLWTFVFFFFKVLAVLVDPFIHPMGWRSPRKNMKKSSKKNSGRFPCFFKGHLKVLLDFRNVVFVHWGSTCQRSDYIWTHKWVTHWNPADPRKKKGKTNV